MGRRGQGCQAYNDSSIRARGYLAYMLHITENFRRIWDWDL